MTSRCRFFCSFCGSPNEIPTSDVQCSSTWYEDAHETENRVSVTCTVCGRSTTWNASSVGAVIRMHALFCYEVVAPLSVPVPGGPGST